MYRGVVWIEHTSGTLAAEPSAAAAQVQAGMAAVSSPVSAASSGPSERRSASGGDSAETAANVSASTGGAARPVW